MAAPPRSPTAWRRSESCSAGARTSPFGLPCLPSTLAGEGRAERRPNALFADHRNLTDDRAGLAVEYPQARGRAVAEGDADLPAGGNRRDDIGAFRHFHRR